MGLELNDGFYDFFNRVIVLETGLLIYGGAGRDK